MVASPGRPLEGLLVVDLSRLLPGPFAARMLANLGARVIKVEEPELGDPVRAAPPFRSGHSLLAESLLSGIESVALDLKKDGGRGVLDDLLATADVLLETFRPGTLARLGLASEDLRKAWPRLVICSISGWGAGGPLATRAGHDLSYQAASGAIAGTGEMPNLPAVDLLGAWSAVAATCAALLARERSGEGCRIDAALFDAALTANLTGFSGESKAVSAVPSPGALTGALPCYRLYETRDGRLFAVAALEEKFWRSFCELIERPDLRAAQYRTETAGHRRVAAVMAGRTAAEWEAIFTTNDIPGGVVITPEEALSSEQATARGLGGIARGGVPFPVLLDGQRPTAAKRFPRLGEHTLEVLGEFSPRMLQMSRHRRVAAGVGPRLSVRRSLQGLVGSLRG